MHYPGACVAYRDGEDWVEVARGHGLLSTTSLALGPAGEVAASTSLGLGLYTDGKWHVLRDGPTRSSVTSVAVTAEGTAWFAYGDSSASTPGGGLSGFDGQTWQYALDDAEVTALAVAPDCTLWAGVDCTIQRFDRGAWETLARCREELAQGNVLDIAFTADGSVWVASGFGLAHFDGQSWTKHEKLVASLTVAPEGATGAEGLWMNGWEGTENSWYVARLYGEDWQPYAVTDSFPGGFSVSAVTLDGQVCGLVPENRLACFDGGSWSEAEAWTIYQGDEPPDLGDISGPPILAPDGALWFRNSVGLVRVDRPGTPEVRWSIYPLDREPLNTVAGPLAFGPDGTVWIGATHFKP
jgi:hypothetical protein